MILKKSLHPFALELACALEGLSHSHLEHTHGPTHLEISQEQISFVRNVQPSCCWWLILFIHNDAKKMKND